MSAAKSLFSQIVDYAGLFPPAQLPLGEVVTNYANYLGSTDAWMLARLIVPASRLQELPQHAAFNDSAHHWKISALVPSVDADGNALSESLALIEQFNQQYSGKAIIDTVEIKAPTAVLVRSTIRQIPESLNTFLEIPHADDPTELIRLIAAAPDHIFAKIRTGGVTADLIPTVAEVARFIHCCGQNDAGFKATAGLHHPLRGEYRLTYDDDAPTGRMFGFVNVFVAACFAFSENNDITLLEQILTSDEPAEFAFSKDQVKFNGATISTANIAKVRISKAVSFGSCSFTEPTSELQQFDAFTVDRSAC